MPEIMSAEEFSGKMEKEISMAYCGDEEHPFDKMMERFTNSIRSRDSAMLERYKEAIEGLKANLPKGFMSHDDEIYYDALSDCVQVLDSAFAEIEGGK